MKTEQGSINNGLSTEAQLGILNIARRVTPNGSSIGEVYSSQIARGVFTAEKPYTNKTLQNKTK